ncbi:MAG: hypothetical protein AB1589_23340 [Cyanobacteriota bacterium]
MSYKVYAPNVHLFAFHSANPNPLSPASTKTHYNEELLWEKCGTILQKFHIGQRLKIKKNSNLDRASLLEEAADNTMLLPLEGKIITEAQKHHITGFTCPLKIEDSYALALNVRIPELSEKGQKTGDVDLNIFRTLNPDNCFLYPNVKSSLGQTILLTAWLSQKQQQGKNFWQDIADECVQNFLGKNQEYCPPLYQAGQLFGSPIFEYGNPYQPQEHGPIFVWLYVREAFNGKPDSRLDNSFGFFYQKFIDLCLYRQKASQAYKRTLDVYADIQQSHQTLKEIIHKIADFNRKKNQLQKSNPANSLSKAEISYFKTQLSILPKLALDYAEAIQALESYRLEIERNTKNYAERIRQIQERLSNPDLSFLSKFYQKIGGDFQDDIKVKLGECEQNYRLVEQAIASIRGLVEIDKVQHDRTLEETMRLNEVAAQEREKKLQIWFALVVGCLAVTSISSQGASPMQTIFAYLNSAQSSGSPLESFANFLLANFFDIVLQTIAGVTIALLLGLIVWLIAKQSNQMSNSKDRD